MNPPYSDFGPIKFDVVMVSSESTKSEKKDPLMLYPSSWTISAPENKLFSIIISERRSSIFLVPTKASLFSKSESMI